MRISRILQDDPLISRLFRNPRAAQVGIAVFLVLIVAAFATRCRAAELRLEGGSAVVHGETPVLGLSLAFGREVGQDFGYECGLLLIGAAGRSANQIAASCQIVDGFGRFDLGLGLAALQNEDEWNSGRMNFSLLARYRFTDRLSLTYRHISNAGTHMPNVGRDIVLLGWSF